MPAEDSYRLAERADLLPLAEWLVAHGSAPERHCLHTWSGESGPELGQRLQGCWDEGELCFVLAHRTGQRVGALGSEYDRALGRAWLYGPHVSADDWEDLAGGLYTHLMAALPAEIRQWDAYLNVEHARGRRFYAGRGFAERPQPSLVYELTPERRVRTEPGGAQPLPAGEVESFQELFAALFPNTYFSPQRIVEMIGGSHHILSLSERGRVLAFAVLSVDEGGTTGEVQFLGVREAERGRGLGRRLLLAGVDWLFDQAGRRSISLNVHATHSGARRLYESAGFRLRYAGIGLRRESQPAGGV